MDDIIIIGDRPIGRPNRVCSRQRIGPEHGRNAKKQDLPITPPKCPKPRSWIGGDDNGFAIQSQGKRERNRRRNRLRWERRMGSKAMAQKKASKPFGRTSAELPSSAQTWRGRPVELQGKRLRLESGAVAEGSAPGSGASGLCLATGRQIGKTRLHLESGAVAEGGSQECAPGLCLATGSKVRGSAGTPSARRAKAPTTSAAGPTACAGPSGSGSAETPSARCAKVSHC